MARRGLAQQQASRGLRAPRRGDALDPAELAAASARRLLGAPGADALRAFDALLLARGLGRDGDGDVQFEIYRALEGSGSLVVNRIDALLAAQDKLRTSWLLRRARIATPAATVAQTPATRRAARGAPRPRW